MSYLLKKIYPMAQHRCREALNLDEFSLPEEEASAFQSPSAPTPAETRGPFLKGPISWPWLLKAGRLPGHALHVAVVLQQLKGCRRGNTFRFGYRRMLTMGVGRWATRRALRALESAGLIALAAAPGQGVLVTILPATQQNGAAL
jgi:hypothetical protein